MATLPIPGLLAEFKILGLQAMDFGAQFSHFRARVLHWGDQLREEMTGKTDLCQLAVHDQLGLAEIAPKGKRLVLFHPEQKTQKERDGQRFTKMPSRRGANEANPRRVGRLSRARAMIGLKRLCRRARAAGRLGAAKVVRCQKAASATRVCSGRRRGHPRFLGARKRVTPSAPTKRARRQA